MARYVVFVKEADDGDRSFAPWMGLVEADGPIEAVYQYPRYHKMWKREFFLETHKSPECFAKNWGDIVCVQELNQMLGQLLST